jgi:Tfp pilus assembly protein PilX
MFPERSIYSNEKGVVLVVALAFMVVLGLLGTTAYISTTTDMKIGGNYKTNVQAFYNAEAGIREAIYRLGLHNDNLNAPPLGSMIVVNGLANNNAHISLDPNGLLSNATNEDGDGATNEIDELNYNSNWQTKIMLNTSEAGYTDTTTTIYTTTIQPSASWLEYSSATVDGTELTIEFKHDTGDMDGDADTQEIVFYDAGHASGNPYHVDGTGGNPATGQPIVVITSTGRSQRSMRTIQIEATYQPVAVLAEAAVMVDMVPDLTGSALISGFDHDFTTTSADEKDGPKWHETEVFRFNGVDNHGGAESWTYPNPSPPPASLGNTSPDITDTLFGGCSAPPTSQEEVDPEHGIPYGQMLETNLSNYSPGVWSTKAGVAPNADVFGGNDTEPWKDEDVGAAWIPLWQMLGLGSQAALDAILATANVTEAHVDGSGILTAAPQGLIHIDNAGGDVVKLTSATPADDDGWGLMYITGDAQFQSLEFKGLIYIEGDADITGNFWLMGCMAIKGTAVGDFSAGNGTFLYSKDALDWWVNKGLKFVTLTWREVVPT